MSDTDLYNILNIVPNATKIEIKRAYRKLALVHHPDKGGDEVMFKKITSAYEVLIDDDKRRLYDTYGKKGLQGEQGIPSDIFANLFGSMNPIGNIFNMFRDIHKATRRADPITYRREVTLEELCTRKVLSIKVTRNRVCPCQQNSSAQMQCHVCNGSGRICHTQMLSPGIMQQINRVCSECNGRGVIVQSCMNCSKGLRPEDKIFTVHLSPDMESGYQYKFPGDGNEGIGVLPGDFIVVIIHKRHDTFSTTGNKHLVYKREISLKDALCGYSAVVRHPSGENISISFPGVIKPGDRRVISGKGMVFTADMIINHSIVFPTTLTENQCKKIEKILN